MSSGSGPGLSGKTARQENFPVGSVLIAPRLRPHVMAFYDFARAADDIADSRALPPDEKLARLDAMGNALTDAGIAARDDRPEIGTAHRLRASLAECGLDAGHPLTLLEAFRHDAVENRTPDWAALMHYCSRSANPVGRYLLDLHGENDALYEGSDALCTVLQVLNHVQDCVEDRRTLDRVYVPESWLAEAGLTVEALDAPADDPRLEDVIARMLDRCEKLLLVAAPLSKRLRNRRLAAETAVITQLAKALCARLRSDKPLARRVTLRRMDFLLGAWSGLRTLLAFDRDPRHRTG